jgi:hypothetical protein
LACDSDLHVNHRVLLDAANLQHGTDGFSSPPKEVMLLIFSARKIRRIRLDGAHFTETQQVRKFLFYNYLKPRSVFVITLYTNHDIDSSDGAVVLQVVCSGLWFSSFRLSCFGVPRFEMILERGSIQLM